MVVRGGEEAETFARKPPIETGPYYPGFIEPGLPWLPSSRIRLLSEPGVFETRLLSKLGVCQAWVILEPGIAWKPYGLELGRRARTNLFGPKPISGGVTSTFKL
ncbi:hypothetical protein L6452_22373 [Arctium lappa]|uniref:Uncharacterized protein n=1 Tax=Arctium lappa TaxID=4217 RepID=A0ACB9B0W3_ARCLA|nr:hypothetical protein L6452_22373 [Arctium lappa]